jgi:putative two-component system response regulator
MVSSNESALASIESEVRANLASPRPDTLAFLNEALRRLKSVPLVVDPGRRIDCLLAVAQQFHHQGQSTFSAVEPVALAVMLAREVADKPVLRRALNLQGIVLSATNNPGDALRSLVEALEIAEELGDRAGLASVWINIGAAFYEAALYSDSQASLQRASTIAIGISELRNLRSMALANAALCCLHTHNYPQGIELIRDAIGLMPAPRSVADMLLRVFAEGNFTRLLLATGRVQEAAERAQLAKEFAAGAKSVRGDISAACSEGLVEVYSGRPDTGLSRSIAALEKARAVKPSLRETLLALVQAYEKAGRPDRALALHRELTMHIRKAQQENIVKHHELHLKRLEIHEGNQFPEWVLSEKDEELRDSLVAQFAGAKQGDLLEQFAFTAELRDDPSGEHCYRVAKLAALLAVEHGEDDAFCDTLELATRLHDIGKVAIPDTVLNKAKPLTDGERAILETHAATGADLLSRTKVAYAPMAEEIARHHHERWEGDGYPDGISGTAIPLPARMVALADAFDALTHAKPYRRAWTADEAIDEIIRQKGQQFDPALTDLFVPLIERLREEQADLDAFLGEAAHESSIKQARRKIARSLAKPIEPFGPTRQPGEPPATLQ